MTDAEDLKAEFQRFRLETKARLDSYPMLNDERYEQLLTNVLSKFNRDEEKINLLRRIEKRLIIACISSFFVGGFILFTLWFTVPA